VRELHRAEHDLFRKLLGFGFDHHHRVAGGGDDQVEFAGLDLLDRRIEDIFAVDVADAGCADRAHERHARNRQCRRGGDHRQHVGLVLAIIAEHLRDHVDLVVETFGEQRADRAIDETRGQRLLFGRAALTLEEAAGDAAGRRIFFLIVNGEREEILPFLHAACGRDGAQHDGFAEGRDDRAVGLTGNTARFQGEGLSAPLDFNFLDIEHLGSFSPDALCVRGLCRWPGFL
jgi:hypothetical protein